MSCRHLALAALGILLLSPSASRALDQSNDFSPPVIEGGDTAEGKPIAKKFTTIIIPWVNFERTDIAQVIGFLRNKSKALDPEHIGVKFRLAVPPDSDSKPSGHQRQVGLTLEDEPIGHVINYVCVETELDYKIADGTVVLYPAESQQERDARIAVILKKFRTIIIPNVNFQKLDIAAVADFLTVKSKELDPEHTGITFVLRLPPENSEHSPYTREISMNPHDASIKDVLDQIQQQTNLIFTFHAKEVVFGLPETGGPTLIRNHPSLPLPPPDRIL